MTKLAAYIVGIAVAITLAALAWAGYATRAKSAAEARAEVANARADSASLRADAKATVFFHDTARVYRSVDKVVTQLERIIDTAIVEHVDTVRVPVPVIVAARDTLKACKAAVVSCADALAEQKEATAKWKDAAAKWEKAATVGTLFGIPLPRVTAGYAIVYDPTTQRVQHGPSLSLGWQLSF